jgi:hypothetical protein
MMILLAEMNSRPALPPAVSGKNPLWTVLWITLIASVLALATCAYFLDSEDPTKGEMMAFKCRQLERKPIAELSANDLQLLSVCRAVRK